MVQAFRAKRDNSNRYYEIFHSFNTSPRKKCPYSELFWPTFFRIRTEYGEILLISPYSVRMRENADQNNSENGQFLCSASVSLSSFFQTDKIIYTWISNNLLQMRKKHKKNQKGPSVNPIYFQLCHLRAWFSKGKCCSSEHTRIWSLFYKHSLIYQEK